MEETWYVSCWYVENFWLIIASTSSLLECHLDDWKYLYEKRDDFIVKLELLILLQEFYIFTSRQAELKTLRILLLQPIFDSFGCLFC